MAGKPANFTVAMVETAVVAEAAPQVIDEIPNTNPAVAETIPVPSLVEAVVLNS